jgi:WD40 repeat protein
VRVWNVQTGECTHTLEARTNEVWCVAFDGATIVSGSQNGTVHIWRAPYNTAECEHVFEGHTAEREGIQYGNSVARVWLCTAPNEHIVVSVDMNNTVRVHDIRTGDRLCAPIDCVDCKLS